MGLNELPVLQLGLAGFSPEQEQAIQAVAAASRLTHWSIGPMTAADAWFINGQCTQHLGGGRVRVASRVTGGRSVQLQLSETQRPVGFARPVPAMVQAACSFDVDDHRSILEAIGVFEFGLAPQAAQYLLAAQIVDQQEILGSGAYELRARGQLIAAVDMRGETGVLPSARPPNFEVAVWTRIDRDRFGIPANFTRCSLSELMWRYAARTPRDLLPERYREGLIYFRRGPRVDPVLVEEEHLLVMRELAIRPGALGELAGRLGMAEASLARILAALYYVGSVTTNRTRAAPSTVSDDLPLARAASHYGELRTARMPLELADLRLLTAPSPLGFA